VRRSGWVLLLAVMVGRAPLTAQATDDARRLAPPATAPRARASIDASSHYETNVRFFGPAVAGDRYNRAGGVVAGGVANARTRLEVEAHGEIVRFDLLRDLDRETYDLGLLLSHRVNPRVSTSLSARALTSAAPAGLEQLTLVFQPLTVVRAQNAVGSMVMRLSPRVDLTTELDGTRVRFDDAAFVGGGTAGGRVVVGFRPTARRLRGVITEVRRATFAEQVVYTGLLEGEWRQPVGRAQLAVRAGTTTLRVPADADPLTVIPTGSVELMSERAPYQLAARYAHAVTPVFGFGRALQSDQVSLSVARTRVRGTTLRVTVDGSRNVDPVDRAINVNFATATSEVRQYVGGGLTLAFTGFVRRRIEGDRANNAGGSVLAAFGGAR
jgi:hypothetical protein